MFTTFGRTVVTCAAMLEVGIAGYALGHGALWLLAVTAAVTLADTAWGVARRGVPGDLAGLQVAAALALMLVTRAGSALSVLTATACVAWLIRPDRLGRPGR
ncbi:MAG TPA: hypothetical protein VMU66_06685 [Gaiellales bacterium]|nr:hypothetical protein [Gaiellales bacterium]